MDTTHANKGYRLQAQLRPIIQELEEEGWFKGETVENYRPMRGSSTFECDWWGVLEESGRQVDIECDYTPQHGYGCDNPHDVYMRDRKIEPVRITERHIRSGKAKQRLVSELKKINAGKSTQTSKEAVKSKKMRAPIDGPIVGFYVALSRANGDKQLCACAMAYEMVPDVCEENGLRPARLLSDVKTAMLSLGEDCDPEDINDKRRIEYALIMEALRMAHESTLSEEAEAISPTGMNVILYVDTPVYGLTTPISSKRTTTFAQRYKERYDKEWACMPLFLYFENANFIYAAHHRTTLDVHAGGVEVDTENVRTTSKAMLRVKTEARMYITQGIEAARACADYYVTGVFDYKSLCDQTASTALWVLQESSACVPLKAYAYILANTRGILYNGKRAATEFIEEALEKKGYIGYDERGYYYARHKGKREGIEEARCYVGRVFRKEILLPPVFSAIVAFEL